MNETVLPPADPQVLAALAAAFAPSDWSATEPERRAAARDCWPRTTIAALAGRLGPLPDAVVWPRCTADVQRVLGLARELGVPVIPYGGGSGVCGGVVPIRRGITLDLKRMTRILDLDETSLTVTAEAGINGELLERHLAERGYSLGHFPSSIYCSTLGGWIATRAAGQLSTLYGCIEDMVLGLKAVLPDGSLIEERIRPRAAVGPDLARFLIGSEGTLGVITETTLRVHPEPEHRGFRAFQFRDVASAVEAIRVTLRRGIFPAAVRLYDELDTFMVGSGKGQAALSGPEHGDSAARESRIRSLLHHAQRFAIAHPDVARVLLPLLPASCLLILTFEGAPRKAEAEEALAAEVCRAHGGADLGPEPARRWWHHRYKVSYGLSAVFDSGAFADTMEVAAPWRQLMALYQNVRAALSGRAVVMAHFSHAYPDGCSIYFTFAARAETPEAAQTLYDELWDAGLQACLAAGGTISHHHGIGLSKSKWMAAEHGHGLRLLQAVKDALDPQHLLNPGKLGLRPPTGGRS